MRKIKAFERRTASGQVRKAIAYLHADWNWYFVRFWIDGEFLKTVYPTEEMQDAIDTADHFVNGKE